MWTRKTVFFATLLSALLFASTVTAQDNLLEKARNAFNSAEQLEENLNAKPVAERSRTEHLKVINAFQRVYLITPRTSYADDALITIAKLYEEIDEQGAALRTLNFLIREYPGSPFRHKARESIARIEGTPEQLRTTTKSAAIDDIHYLEEPNSVRVIVELNSEATFKQGAAKSPDRVFIDINPARLNSALLNKQWPVNSELVNQIRVGQFDNSTVRVVLDVGRVGKVTAFTLREPDRIVIDVPRPQIIQTQSQPVPLAPQAALLPSPVTGGPAVVPATPPAAAPVRASVVAAAVIPSAPPDQHETKPAEVGKVVTPAKPTNGGARSLIRSLGLKLSRVVIDAGHGGHDTGSIGPTGYTEKEFVLDVADRLKQLVESELGAEVVMTRTEDSFVPLESRTAIANGQAADLFISIHANSSKIRTVRGVETFFLNITTSREALDTASRENATSAGSIHELEDLVKKIMMRDKIDESRELAQHLQKAMAARKGAGPDRGVKEAPFVVLIGANMPSVLAEIGFISNPQEERLIKTSKYRQQIAESLFEGVRSYTETLSGIKTAEAAKSKE